MQVADFKVTPIAGVDKRMNVGKGYRLAGDKWDSSGSTIDHLRRRGVSESFPP
jgi:hypothetical protein